MHDGNTDKRWGASPHDGKIFFFITRVQKREGEDGRLFLHPLPLTSSCIHTCVIEQGEKGGREESKRRGEREGREGRKERNLLLLALMCVHWREGRGS